MTRILAVLRGGDLDGKTYAVDSSQESVVDMEHTTEAEHGTWQRTDEDAAIPESLADWCEAQGIESAKVFDHVAP